MVDISKEEFIDKNVSGIHAPWEKSLNRITTPFERFVNHQATAGLLLMFTALLALLIANSPLLSQYQALLKMQAGFQIGDWVLEKSVHHWINDGLMALFFFVVGLELKREILVGELANLRMATLPIAAAIGGMVIPAIIYVIINAGNGSLNGWGIPMATDIAFALGVIALLAGRVPKALITFLVAVAIVDDLGAVMVIALFYTETLVWEFILIGAALTGLMVAANLAGIRNSGVYFFLGVLLWFVLLKSGVHATLAGVITAFTIPAFPRFNPDTFSQRTRQLLDKFDDSYSQGESILKNQEMVALVQTLEDGVKGVKTPLQRLEHGMHTPVAFIVLPLFALFNAGVAIDFSQFTQSLLQPITLGVSLGLIVGKLIGIVGFSWLALKMQLATLPTGVYMKHIIGAAFLASIGFTMSIFIAELAFAGQAEMILQAKLGILLASIAAGITGYIWLYKIGEDKKSPALATAKVETSK
jgi:NhaA family Na+:H+ antiporter